jgi:hypothetical protein
LEMLFDCERKAATIELLSVRHSQIVKLNKFILNMAEDPLFRFPAVVVNNRP